MYVAIFMLAMVASAPHAPVVPDRPHPPSKAHMPHERSAEQQAEDEVKQAADVVRRQQEEQRKTP